MTNQTKNVPELRFPEFDGEWEENKLIDVLKDKSEGIKRGPFGGALKKDIFIEDGYAIYEQRNAIYDMQQFRYFITQQKYDEMIGFAIKPNDIIMSCSGTIGKLSLIPENAKQGIINQALIRFRTNDKLLSNYFLIYMNSQYMQRKILESNPGSAITNLIPVKELKKLNFPSPKINEQQKIGSFFSKLDRQIELEEQKLAKLEEQKKGYMQKIFSQEIRFKDDNGNSYPEWESAPLFDIFSATKGKSLSKDKISNDGKYECILYGEIYTTYAEKIESIVSRTNYYEGILSQKNDLIFPNSTTTNAWDLATFSSLQKNNVLIGGDISILRTKRSDISSLFYAYYLTNYLKLRKDIAKYAQGITIVHLSFNNFCKIKVQIPSLEEQNSITDFIDSLNQQQKLITNKIKLLKERKKGFLQKMFV